MKDKIDASPCAINVAQATPETPRFVNLTRMQSSITLKTDDKIKKKRGVYESPKAVKMPVQILYKNKKIRPIV